MAHGVVWTTAGLLAAQAGTFICNIIAARILGREYFGALGILQSTALALGGILAAGLSVTSTRYVARYKAADPDRAGRILGLLGIVSLAASGTFALALVLFAPVLASRGLGAPELAPYLRICAIYVFFFSLSGYQSGALVGLGAFRRLARLNAMQGVIAVAATAVLSWRMGLAGAALAQATSMASLWLLSQWLLRSECRNLGIAIRYSDIWRERAAFSSFALPAVLSGIPAQIGIWGGSALLVRQHGGLSEMAIYSVANAYRLVVTFAPNVVNRVAAPVLCGSFVPGEARSFRRSLLGATLANTLAAAAVALGIVVAAGPLLALFGRQFSGARTAICVLMASAVVEAFAQSLFQALVSSGKMWGQAKAMALWSACLIGCAWQLAPLYGAAGLGAAYLAAWIVVTGYYAICARRALHTLAADVPGPGEL